MTLFFLGMESSLKLLQDDLERLDQSFRAFDSREPLVRAVCELEGAPCFVVMDFETYPEMAAALNAELVTFPHVVRLHASESLDIKDLKEHQLSEEGCHAYIRFPIDVESFLDVLDDLEEAEAENLDPTRTDLSISSDDFEGVDADDFLFSSDSDSDGEEPLEADDEMGAVEGIELEDGLVQNENENENENEIEMEMEDEGGIELEFDSPLPGVDEEVDVLPEVEEREDDVGLDEETVLMEMPGDLELDVGGGEIELEMDPVVEDVTIEASNKEEMTEFDYKAPQLELEQGEEQEIQEREDAATVATVLMDAQEHEEVPEEFVVPPIQLEEEDIPLEGRTEVASLLEADEADEIGEEEIREEKVDTENTKDDLASFSGPEVAEELDLIRQHYTTELIKLQETVSLLREDREKLIKEKEEFEDKLALKDEEILGHRSELDDLKIELAIHKKRENQELSDVKNQLRVSLEKQDIYREKMSHYQNEMEKLSGEIRMNLQRVRQREKELENKIEFMEMDSQAQLQSRDEKIRELKRKVDALEFSLENTQVKEQKWRQDKMKLEERIAQMMHTLRHSLQFLETEITDDEAESLRSKKTDECC